MAPTRVFSITSHSVIATIQATAIMNMRYTGKVTTQVGS